VTVGVGPFWYQRLPKLIREAVDLYRRDGRRLAGLDDKQLSREFLAAFKRYVKDQGNRATTRALNEIAAEYVLRRSAAPIGSAADQLSWIIAVSGSEIEQLPLVLLAFRYILCIPALGMILVPNEEQGDEAARLADFQWLLSGGTTPECKPEARGGAHLAGRDVA
jgi:hypothetical protein